MHINADLVLETTVTTGTGTLTLAGAADGYRTFAAGVGEGNTVSYAIQASNGQLETGVGTVVGSTLERTTLVSSSTGAKLNLPAGTHQVGSTANSYSLTLPALGAGATGEDLFVTASVTDARETIRVFVKDTEPSSPINGDVWVDTSADSTPAAATGFSLHPFLLMGA